MDMLLNMQQDAAVGWYELAFIVSCSLICYRCVCKTGRYYLYILDAHVHPYGSSMSNFALADSDLNVDVEVGDPAKFLTELLEVLRRDKTGANLWC